MANVEPIAPTIDFEALLQPIPGNNPSGEPMGYSGLYDEIREARRADKDINQGEWKTDLKVANFRQVIDLAVPALSTQTKDLQIGVWLCEALTGQFGFAGLRDGIQLLRRLEEDFWFTLYPEIDEGDAEARANAIDWLNNQMSLGARKITISQGDGLSYNDWDESTRFDIPEDLDSVEFAAREKLKALKIQAETEKRITGEMWRKAKNSTNRAFCETLNLTINECLAELNSFDKTNEEKFERNQVPSINNLKKILNDISATVTKVLQEKRELEPDPEEVEEVTEEVSEDGETVVRKGPATATGAIQSRQDALKRLSDIADYFRKNEPSSPLSPLLQRAVKWGNMPFDVLIQDMIKDDNVVGQVRQTLGFNTVSADSTESQ